VQLKLQPLSKHNDPLKLVQARCKCHSQTFQIVLTSWLKSKPAASNQTNRTHIYQQCITGMRTDNKLHGAKAPETISWHGTWQESRWWKRNWHPSNNKKGIVRQILPMLWNVFGHYVSGIPVFFVSFQAGHDRSFILHPRSNNWLCLSLLTPNSNSHIAKRIR
jgi:hypothetical protein